MYTLGEVVALTQNGERSVGEVVSVQRVLSTTYYDVSLERVVVKAATQEELEPVTAHEIRGLLTGIMGVESSVLLEKDAFLRQRYAAFLTRALATMESDEDSVAASSDFFVGDLVEVHTNNVRSLGTIRGVYQQNGNITYEVEVMGEVERLYESDIVRLRQSDADSGLQLGTRVRLVANGHEDDEAYVGILCSIEAVGNRAEYSIQFEDGDILGGLDASDIIPSPHLDKDGVA